MKIVIQGYWNATVKSAEPPKNGADERIRRGETITVCDIVIDGKLKGSVTWNGTILAIAEL